MVVRFLPTSTSSSTSPLNLTYFDGTNTQSLSRTLVGQGSNIPSVYNISPSAGSFAGGDTVTINGTNFSGFGTPTVFLGGIACSGVTAYGALKKIPKLIPGDHVVLIGLGGVGLAGVAIAQGMIDAPIIAVDIDDAKLAAAKAMGIAKTLNSSGPDAAKRLKELAGGRVAAAVDFVGASATARLGLDALNKGGTYIIVGLFGGEVTLPLVTIPMRALTVRGSYVGTLGEMRELLALVRGGKVKPMPVGRRRLDEVNQTLEDLKAGRIVGRVVLAP